MDPPSVEWEQRLGALWDAYDSYASPAAFVDAMRALTAELPAGHPVRAFELGGAFDSTGQPESATALYRQALDDGLTGDRRRQAVIQLASSLRNLGRAEEAVALLSAERANPTDDLDDAVAAFLALALVDSGRAREAVGVALTALASHMTRYQRSLSAYAQALAADGSTEG